VKTVETTIARYTLRDDGIVVACAINPEAPRTYKTAAATLDALAELIGEAPRPALWDQRETPRLAPEVWIQVIARIEKLAVALAILTNEGGSRQLGGYPDAIGALLIPAREFHQEEPAIAWLRQFCD
jgi:hypothetical protein